MQNAANTIQIKLKTENLYENIDAKIMQIFEVFFFLTKNEENVISQ